MNNLEKLLEQLENGERLTLLSVLNGSCTSCPFTCDCKSPVVSCVELRARWLLQEYVEPDSFYQCKEDAKKTTSDYWGCYGVDCGECPARFSDGTRPWEHYDSSNCQHAQMCDLVARCEQLALDGVV